MAIFEFVGARIHPGPGTQPDSVVLPGPGLYEMDFAIPGWLPEYDSTHSLTVNVGGYHVQHIHSYARNGKLSIRLRTKRDEKNQVRSVPGTEIAIIDDLAIGEVLQALAAVIGGAILGWILQSLVQAIKEIRKIVEIGPVQLAIGLGAIVFLIPRARHALHLGG